MNSELFMKWVREKLLPYFERKYPGKKMVFVADNAPYHHTREIGALGGLKKGELIDLMKKLVVRILISPSTMSEMKLSRRIMELPKCLAMGSIGLSSTSTRTTSGKEEVNQDHLFPPCKNSNLDSLIGWKKIDQSYFSVSSKSSWPKRSMKSFGRHRTVRISSRSKLSGRPGRTEWPRSILTEGPWGKLLHISGRDGMSIISKRKSCIHQIGLEHQSIVPGWLLRPKKSERNLHSHVCRSWTFRRNW